MNIAYRQYLKSEDWKRKRLEALVFHGGKCTKCNEPIDNPLRLHVHHTLYTTDLRLVPIISLKPICEKCHAKEHVTAHEFIDKWLMTGRSSVFSLAQLRKDWHKLLKPDVHHLLEILDRLPRNYYESTTYWQTLNRYMLRQRSWTCSTCRTTGKQGAYLMMEPGWTSFQMVEIACIQCTSCRAPAPMDWNPHVVDRLLGIKFEYNANAFLAKWRPRHDRGDFGELLADYNLLPMLDKTVVANVFKTLSPVDYLETHYCQTLMHAIGMMIGTPLVHLTTDEFLGMELMDLNRLSWVRKPGCEL